MKLSMPIVLVVLIVGLLALVPNGSATGYMNGPNWTNIDNIWDSLGMSYLKNSSLLAGGNITLTKNANGSVIISATGGGSTETTWTANRDASGYNLTGASNITSKQIGGVIYADQYATIQGAIDACATLGSACQKVVITGTNNIPLQPAGSPTGSVGLYIYSNQIIEFAPEASITNTSWVYPVSGGQNITMISNKHPITGDTNIQIINANILVPYPKILASGQGMDAWGAGIYFSGASNSKVIGANITNGFIGFLPSTSDIGSMNFITGTNHDNLVTDSVIYNETGTSSFYDGYQNTWTRSNIIRSWDDTFGFMGSGGRDNTLSFSDINATAVEWGRGGSSGVILIGGNNNKILYNNIHDFIGKNTSGSSWNGIYFTTSNNSKIIGNTITGMNGSGINIETANSVLNYTISDNIISENGLIGGCCYSALQNKPAGNFIHSGTISNNYIINNTWRGIDLYVYGYAKDNIFGNTITGNGAEDLYVNTETGWSNRSNLYIHDNIIGTIGSANEGFKNTTLRDNYGQVGFNHGNSAAAPTAFGNGDTYFDTALDVPRFYNSSGWQSVGSGGTGSSYNSSYAKGGLVFTIENGTNVIGSDYTNSFTTVYAGTLTKLISHSTQSGSINVSFYNASNSNSYIGSVAIAAGTDASTVLSYPFADETRIMFNITGAVTDIKQVGITVKATKS